MNPEKINNNDENNANEWDMSDVQDFNALNTEDVNKEAQNNNAKDENLKLFTEVEGGYKISSMPFEDKKEAYEEIENNWKGADTTTYFHNGKWYVVSK